MTSQLTRDRTAHWRLTATSIADDYDAKSITAVALNSHRQLNVRRSSCRCRRGDDFERRMFTARHVFGDTSHFSQVQHQPSFLSRRSAW